MSYTLKKDFGQEVFVNEVFLNDFQVVKPRHCSSQEDLLEWIILCHQEAEKNSDQENKIDIALIKKLFLRYGVKSSQIAQRYTECEDIKSFDFKKNTIYKLDENHFNGSDIKARADFFSDRAFEVFNKFYDLDEKKNRPDHLIHVTCTGYISPSAAQKIVASSKWDKNTEITHAYHMGCYASLPAVRLAKNNVMSESHNNPDFTTDIVHNEMCGLHMNALAHTPEQMVVQTLFADGHIKYTASAKKMADNKNLKIIATLEKVIPDSVGDMSWIPSPWGMQMNLSREVPSKIKPELKKFLEDIFVKANIDTALSQEAVFAIHPGGPKIIDSVQEVLELREDQVRECRKILSERGNMSSATLPHVWEEILNNKYPSGTKVVSFAFGPGLTLFGALFEIC
jgi:predicted naringenin-chalcone synthase